MKIVRLARRVLRRVGLADVRLPFGSETHHQNHARLFRRDIARSLRGVAPASGRQRLVFWTPFSPWYHTLIEYFLATKLRLLGHEVVVAACDGEPPHCAMDRAKFVRPQCTDCKAHSDYLFQSFDLPACRLQEFVGRAEQESIADHCRGLDAGSLRAFCLDGIPLGEHAARFLTTYYNGFVELESQLETAQRILSGEWVQTLYAERMARQLTPDRVLMFSGNDAQHFGPFRRLRQMGVAVTTWDESGQWSDGFYFMHEACAGDVALEHLWQAAAPIPLTIEQEAQVTTYLAEWRRGVVCGTRYHPSPESNVPALRQRLRLPEGRQMMLALPNVVWDSNVVSKNVGFKDLREWVRVLVDWFSRHPDSFLVLRAHPAEKKVALDKHVTRADSTLSALLGAMYPKGLPENVRFIPAEDDADTYVLGELADCVCVYTSNIAMELALRGRRAWVAGLSFYRGKGFTRDLESPEHLVAALEAGGWSQPMSAQEVAAARRFLYLWVFRHAARIPWHRRERDTYAYPPVHFRDFDFLLPGGDPQLDAVVDRLLTGEPFLDVPWRSQAVWRREGQRRWQYGADNDGVQPQPA